MCFVYADKDEESVRLIRYMCKIASTRELGRNFSARGWVGRTVLLSSLAGEHVRKTLGNACVTFDQSSGIFRKIVGNQYGKLFMGVFIEINKTVDYTHTDAGINIFWLEWSSTSAVLRLLLFVNRWGGGGGGGTPYSGTSGEAPPESGIFFRLFVYKRVGISWVGVWERYFKLSFRCLKDL